MEAEGRQHHQREEGIAAMGGRHHRPNEEGREKFHLFLLQVLPSFSSVAWGVFFPVSLWVVLMFLLFPVGWCRFLSFFEERKKK